MGYMQVYRVGGERAESAMRKISQLLTGEGIDCDELGEQRPDMGCVLIDFTAGEDLVLQTEATVPQLPQILAASTQTLGGKQLEISDEFVSPDLPDEEIIRRVQCMQNMAVRILEEVPEPAHNRILLDGTTEGEDAPLEDLAGILNSAGIEWSLLEEETDTEGTGIVYTHYRRLSYARLLQTDYPGYIHIQMAPTPELRVEALTVGDISYTPNITAEVIAVRHTRFLHMLERLRNPDAFRRDPLDERALSVLFIGDRNLGTSLKNGMGEEVSLQTQASVAGAVTEAKKHDAVLIYLGGPEEAKERFSFLQVLLKQEDRPPLALLFLKSPPDQIRNFCEKQGVAIIESKSSEAVRDALLALQS